MKMITLAFYMFVSLVLVLTLSVRYGFAVETNPRHLYSKGSQEEALALIKKQSGEFPKILGGLSYEWVLDPAKVKYTENIKIDGKDMVVIVYTETKYSSRIFDEELPYGSSLFIQNGFFISTVDLESINCKILRKRKGNVKKIPRGAYTYHTGEEGVLLINAEGEQWIILFEKAVEGSPTSNIALRLEIQPMSDSTEGFQIGPLGSCVVFDSKPEIKPPDFTTIKLPTIKMKVCDEEENNK